MDNLSLADISAATRGDGFLEGNGIIILILFFLLLGNGGWGGRGADACATTTQLYDATSQQSMFNGLYGIREAVNAGAYENARLIDNVNYNSMQNTGVITHEMNRGFDSVNYNINNLGQQLSSQLSQCCCDLKTQMLTNRLEDTQLQLQQAQGVIANTVQTQNLLNNLGRYIPYSYANVYGNVYGNGFANGTTIS